MACQISSVKKRDPVHFLKSQGKVFLSFLCTFFFIILTPKKIEIETLKSALGRSISHYYHFLQYLNNYLGQLILNQYIISK